MIITQLAVAGVGRFRSRHIVRGLGPGLNLLCAPNEAGKSTLFRALRAGLFYRHTSTDGEIKTLASFGAQLPATIEVGFEQEGVRYTLTKSFLANRSTRLAKAGQPFAEGRTAEEAVWSILGVAGGSRADDSTFGLLWVRQGASFDPPEPNEQASKYLNRLIEAEIGQVLGGARGERVRESVAAQLANEETERGSRPKKDGSWKKQIDALDAARGQLADVESTLAALDADLATLQERLNRQRQLENPADAAKMQADLDAAFAEQAAAERAQQIAQTAEAEAARLKLVLEVAEGKHRYLVEIDKRIVARRERLQTLRAQLAEIGAAYRAAEERCAECETRGRALAERVAEAEKEFDRLAQLASHLAAATQVQDLRTRLVRASALRDRIAAVQTALTKETVTAAVLRRIEDLSRDLEAKQAQAIAIAARVSVRLGPAAQGRVRVQGEVATSSLDLPATNPIRVDVDDIVSVEVAPGAASDLKAVEALRETLQRELSQAVAASLIDARQRRAQAEALETERRGLAAELAVVAPAERDEDGVIALARNLANTEAALAASAVSVDAAITPEDLARRQDGVQRLRDDLRRRLEECRQEYRAHRHAREAENYRQTLANAEIVREEAELRTDVAASPDDRRPAQLAALAQATDAARSAHAVAEARRLRAAVPSDAQRADLAARTKRLASAIEARRDELTKIGLDIAALQASITLRGGEGIGERKAELEEEVGLAERELARTEQRLAALRLVRDTIDNCRSEARDAYLAPIKAAMKPFLHTLFPDAEAHLDENLAVEGLRRGGAEAEPFHSLSHGTREQIAVVVRLALGQLLAARGQAVPIVLDDALVFSDDERIERMFAALTLAAESQQVIVLTCRSRAFRSLGGRELSIEPDEAGSG